MSAEGMGPQAATTASATTDPVFLPAGYDWKPLDPKYATVELINTPSGGSSWQPSPSFRR